MWQRAVELFDEMMEANIKPDVVSCTALISALGADAQWERAERVIVWMHQVGACPCYYCACSVGGGGCSSVGPYLERFQTSCNPLYSAQECEVTGKPCCNSL